MKVFVSSNDAGGAEALADYLSVKKIDFDCYLTGPALNIFRRKFHKLNEVELHDIRNYSEVLVSTSATSMTEFNVLKIAKSHDIRCTSIIDSGGNISMRYSRQDLCILPDLIIVHSVQISEEIKKTLSSCPQIIIDESYYMANIRLLSEHIMPDCCLYLAEPVSEHALQYFGDENYFGFNEYEALNGFLMNLSRINSKIKQVIIRVHPDENFTKYLECINAFKLTNSNNLQINFSSNVDLKSDLESVCEVYGCSNNAMYIAHLSGLKVTSVLPENVTQYGIYSDFFNVYRY